MPFFPSGEGEEIGEIRDLEKDPETKARKNNKL